jgi:zinc D-Ala-D-Ala dipeptidase
MRCACIACCGVGQEARFTGKTTAIFECRGRSSILGASLGEVGIFRLARSFAASFVGRTRPTAGARTRLGKRPPGRRGSRLRRCVVAPALVPTVLITALVALTRGTASGAENLPAGFVRLREVAPTIRQDMRYAGSFNFTGQVVPGYERPECILREGAAQALARAQAKLAAAGYELKVYDCYRPLRAVRAFVAWAASPGGDSMKAIFYSGLDKSTLFARGYIAVRSKHSLGIAVDIGLVRAGEAEMTPPYRRGRCEGPFDQRVNESSLDLGTAYDCFSELSATGNPNISAKARTNRDILRRALTAEGFRNYSREWWHYEFNEPSARAYDFPVR